MIRYVHGSEDSLDTDVCYVFDKMPSFAECKKFCAEDKTENRNIITIKDGVVDKCFKGTVDEVNNALLRTYPLHEQEFPLLIERTVKRDKHLKYIRAIRIILSYLSRTKYRPQIKKALKSNWHKRLELFKTVDLNKIDFDSLTKNQSRYDICKAIAFQIGQCKGLMNSDTELYTKREIALGYTDLAPFIYRKEDANIEFLNFRYHLFANDCLMTPSYEIGTDGIYFPEADRTYNIIKEIAL